MKPHSSATRVEGFRSTSRERVFRLRPQSKMNSPVFKRTHDFPLRSNFISPLNRSGFIQEKIEKIEREIEESEYQWLAHKGTGSFLEETAKFRAQMEDLALYVRNLNNRVGNLLVRSFCHFLKRLSTFTIEEPVFSRPEKKRVCAEKSVQTKKEKPESPKYDIMQYHIDLEKFKSLEKSCKEIEVWQITKHLDEVLELLSQMQVDVPDTFGYTVPRKGAGCINLERPMKPRKATKGMQTSEESYEDKLREDSRRDNELSLDIYNEYIEKAASENKRAEDFRKQFEAADESLNESRLVNSELNRQLIKIEKNLKTSSSLLQKENHELKENLLQMKLNNLEKLQNKENELFEMKVLKCVAEEKLLQIESAWKDYHNAPFEYSTSLEAIRHKLLQEREDLLKGETKETAASPLSRGITQSTPKSTLKNSSSQPKGKSLSTPINKGQTLKREAQQRPNSLLSQIKALEMQLKCNEESLLNQMENTSQTLYFSTAQTKLQIQQLYTQLTVLNNSRGVQSDVEIPYRFDPDEEYLKISKSPLIRRVFPDEVLFKKLSQELRWELIRIVREHDSGKCGKDCPHLRRLENLRKLYYGERYPIHYTTVEVTSPKKT